MAPGLEMLAQSAVTRILNSLPEGIALVVLAWAMLRVLPKQNSRTRFAVWFLALVAVTSLPFLARFGAERTVGPGIASWRSAIELPGHWATGLFAAWFVIAAIAMARVAVGLWRLLALRRNCTVVDLGQLDSSLRLTVDELRQKTFLFHRPVTIATSEQIRVPAALGLWKAMIVLPAWTLREVAPSDLSIVLRHEFAHLRRWDDWTNLVQKIARAVFFFHPAIWWIEKRLSVEREMACDDAVVAEIANPNEYANCLVTLLEKSVAQRGWTMAQALVHRAREASLRLAQILDRNRPVTTRVSRPVMGLIGAFAVMFVAAAPYAPEFVSFNSGARNAGVSAEVAKAAVDSTIDVRFAPKATAASIHEKTTPNKIRPRAAKALPPRAVPLQSTKPVGDAATIAKVPSLPMIPWIDVSAFGNASDLVPVQTLVFVQSTQFVEPDSQIVWSVRVWRITVIKPETNQVIAIPVPRTT